MKKEWYGKIKLFFSDRKIKISVSLLAISGILLLSAQNIPGFGQLYYKYVYKILLNTVARIFSMFPFSIYEFILIGFSGYFIYGILKYLIWIFKKKITVKKTLIEGIRNLLFYLSLFIFLNMIGQSVNSFRPSFISLAEIEVSDVNEEELAEVCRTIRDRLNMMNDKIDKNDDGLLILDKNAGRKGIENMNVLSDKYPCLKGFYPNPKPYVFSQIMSYQLLQGETTFTIEANYNNDMVESNIPSTICHELSHIQGFNNENEANYISFLACIDSQYIEYQYSGYLMAYVYCMNDLYELNQEAFDEINGGLSPDVKNEIKMDTLFWRRYRGGISKLYNKVYDVLLKAGGQEDGIKSYNGVVKLIVSSYKEEWQ
ncbi:DUF3810 domain-containing protein [uncultured Clostridium sp.]|uniref:DUF3810 domain-containing protein n=1 Tax=uncultured Clostridium sp. TaxID=59620 RepID=UPI0025FA21D6|nr:DUF3810 domain-containing protein [uncultured Clostridium sp.]